MIGDDGGVDFGYRETVLRPRGGQVLAVVVGVVCSLGGIGFLLRGDPVLLLHAVPPLGLVGFAAWAGYWVPSVRLGPAELELVNPLRTVRIAWPAVQDIETRWSLVVTAGDRRYPAWAAPREGRTNVGRVRRGTGVVDGGPTQHRGVAPEGALAGALATRQWEEYRDRGLLGAVEGEGVVVRLHATTITVLGLLVVATLAAASVR